jgi:hypothetical protein
MSFFHYVLFYHNLETAIQGQKPLKSTSLKLFSQILYHRDEKFNTLKMVKMVPGF